jgi:predicted ATPase/Tfp pilus assembly protein PilF
MKAALARHDELLRRCIEAAHGYVFKTVGDAFCAAFETAPDAMSSALDSQAALLSAPWEVPGGIRVRMALHTGTAEERDGDYFGQTLNRVARLLSIGYGGQTLVSLVTAELLRDLLPDDVSLQDLGAHRLKDLLRPESVFQLVRRGLRSDFPALKSLDNHPHNLPLQPNPFVGREKELEAVQSLLTSEQVRVLSLTGVGGTGKTRLSLQAAANLIERFPDGVFFVDLSAIDSAAHVIPMIARTLEVRETGARPLAALLQDALRDKRMLLILDNFEQVMAGVPHVVDLLAACPALKILVTSREALHIRAERVFRVPPLTVPKRREAREMSPSRVSQYEAVSLFVDRATAVAQDFAVTNENAPAVAEICARLDGLPLAIELAAARVNVLTPRAILERLGSTLKLLSGGAADLPFRQRTLRATIEWSYRLLAPAEQQLFRQAAVFSGGCTLDAMEKVCRCAEEGIDVMETLASLVDKSLLNVEEHATGKRFVMFESLREYGLGLLEQAGATREIRDAHARFFLERAEKAHPALSGPDQKAELDALESDWDNFRVALEQFDSGGSSELLARLACALLPFWETRCYFKDAAGWIARAGRAGRDLPAPLRAGLLHAGGVMARAEGAYEQSRTDLEEAASAFARLGDFRGNAQALAELAMTFFRLDDLVQAKEHAARAAAVAARLPDELLAARAGIVQGLVDWRAGASDTARSHFEASREVFRARGSRGEEARATNNLGILLFEQGRYPQALVCFKHALAAMEDLRDFDNLRRVYNNTADIYFHIGEHQEALAYYGKLRVLAEDRGDARYLCTAHEGLAEVLLATGETTKSEAHARRALAAAEKFAGGAELGVACRILGDLSLAKGDRAAARKLYERAVSILRDAAEAKELQKALDGVRRSEAVTVSGSSDSGGGGSA